MQTNASAVRMRPLEGLAASERREAGGAEWPEPPAPPDRDEYQVTGLNLLGASGAATCRYEGVVGVRPEATWPTHRVD